MTKAVYIEWSDAASLGVGGWKERETLDGLGLAKCRSIGWVYRETEDEIVLVAHIDHGPLTSADDAVKVPGPDRMSPEQVEELLAEIETAALEAVREIRAGRLEPRPETCGWKGDGCSYPSICRCARA